MEFIWIAVAIVIFVALIYGIVHYKNKNSDKSGSNKNREDINITKGDMFVFQRVEGGYSIVGLNDCDYAHIEIPAVFNEKPVVSIGDNAFRNYSKIQCVTIPNGVESIGNGAFEWCNNLTDVTIPDSVISIGNNAFAYCTNLTNVQLPNSLVSIGENAFYACQALKSIFIPKSVVSIGKMAFYPLGVMIIYCETKSQPDEWECFLDDGFLVIWNCKNQKFDEEGFCYAIIDGLVYALKDGIAKVAHQPAMLEGDIKIPGKVEYKGETYCITSLMTEAFIDQSDITGITLHDSIARIGADAFSYCGKIKDIIVPKKVNAIESHAFYFCDCLENITIPNSVKSIGEFALFACEKLETINFEGTIEQWKSIAKEDGWNFETGDYEIICTDGTLEKEIDEDE